MADPTNRHTGGEAPGVLAGIRVVVTRAADRAAALAEPLAALGAEVVALPATRVELLDTAPVMTALANVADYDWLVFTSQNAVGFFWDLWRSAGRDAAALAGVRVAAVGPATAAALEQLGIVVSVTPERFVAEGLLDALRARDDLAGRRVLYLAARGAREVLPAGLRALGATVDVTPLYRSVPDGAGAAALRGRLLRDDIHFVTFAAGSSVRAFVDGVGVDAARHAGLVTIGPATSAVVRELGLAVRAEAEPSTLDGLVRAVVAAARAGGLHFNTLDSTSEFHG
ncbi:MAG TPA: uroporphyrinogen-III synthase [Gemmatimonadaceae bacterium]|nr:uroporphyrinogen-III synthase [Gemmatimonadaceae bacterium]